MKLDSAVKHNSQPKKSRSNKKQHSWSLAVWFVEILHQDLKLLFTDIEELSTRQRVQSKIRLFMNCDTDRP